MKIIIAQPVQHDDKTFAPGDKADLPKAAAEALLACGSATLPGDGKPAGEQGSE